LIRGLNIIRDRARRAELPAERAPARQEAALASQEDVGSRIDRSLHFAHGRDRGPRPPVGCGKRDADPTRKCPKAAEIA
jgi:hypothetical protein